MRHRQVLSPQQRDLLNALLEKHSLHNWPEHSPLANVFAGAPLGRRELQVVLLISQGLTNTQIAQQLYLSEETIKSHVRKLLLKLNAASRAHAVAIALRTGLIV